MLIRQMRDSSHLYSIHSWYDESVSELILNHGKTNKWNLHKKHLTIRRLDGTAVLVMTY